MTPRFQEEVGHPAQTSISPPEMTLKLRSLLTLLLVVVAGAAATIDFFQPLGTNAYWLLAVGAGLTLYALVWGSVITRWSLAVRVLVLAYFMPFSIMLELLFVAHPTFADGSTIVRELVKFPDFNSFVIRVQFFGLTALLAGIAVAHLLLPQSDRHRGLPEPEPPETRVLPVPMVALVLFSLTVYTAVTAPRGTIFDTAYSEVLTSGALIPQIAFPGAPYIVYAMLAVLWLDFERTSPRLPDRRHKLLLLLAAVFFIIVVFNLMRGQRSAAGAVVCFLCLYAMGLTRQAQGYFGPRLALKARSRAFWLGTAAAAMASAFILVQTVRESLSTGFDLDDLGQAAGSFYKTGPWPSSTTHMYGLALEFSGGGGSYLGGETYRDYFLSLPPSPITNLLGLPRPISGESGPAWWYRGFSSGGSHPATVAFKNFGWWGVGVVMLCWGLLIGAAEMLFQRPGMWNKVPYIAVLIAAFHCFWYGDMYIVRALMGAALAVLVYIMLREVA